MPARRARPPADPAEELADRLHSTAIHLLRRLRREDSAIGLTAPRLSALSVVVFAGPLALGELAAAEQVRPPTMTRLVTALEGLGLVVRRSDPEDGRQIRIQATPSGRAVLARGRARRIEALAGAVRALDARERALLADATDLLDRVIREMP
ncbi:MAG TPA: MarR family transcriptional regulator [Gemmatimonadaceae bacterium]|nr:MarR family transcriptional regulator [Gemmatimonadaceae bacterium]